MQCVFHSAACLQSIYTQWKSLLGSSSGPQNTTAAGPQRHGAEAAPLTPSAGSPQRGAILGAARALPGGGERKEAAGRAAEGTLLQPLAAPSVKFYANSAFL